MQLNFSIKLNKPRKKLTNLCYDLCRNSMWGKARRNEIVTNLSSWELSSNEMESLSYGLKFDSGKDRLTLVEHISKNYRSNDTNVDP